MKDNLTLTASVKSSFDESFEKVNHNLLWFNTYGEAVSQWAIENEIEEKKEEGTTQKPSGTTKEPSGTTRKPSDSGSTVSPTQTTKPAPSSAPSIGLSHFMNLQLIVLPILVKIYIL